MIVEPEKYLAEFAARGADMLTVHVEACPHLQRTLASIRELSTRRGAAVRCGAALNPATHPSTLDYVLDDLDLVLVMSVNPGFGGQTLIPAVYPKIRQIRAQLGARAVDVSIDGGVKVEHARCSRRRIRPPSSRECGTPPADPTAQDRSPAQRSRGWPTTKPLIPQPTRPARV